VVPAHSPILTVAEWHCGTLEPDDGGRYTEYDEGEEFVRLFLGGSCPD
jgi:hypothetical protein